MQNKNPNVFKINEKKNYWTLLVFVPLLCFFIYFEFLMILKFSTFLGINILFFLAVGFVLFLYLRTFLWIFFGYEEVIITNENLIIKQKGTYLTKTKIYNLKSIKNIKVVDNPFKFWNFFVSKTSLTTLKSFGPITFEYETKIINFGGNINFDQENEIMQILKTRINEF
jgi:hypothetical protein